MQTDNGSQNYDYHLANFISGYRCEQLISGYRLTSLSPFLIGWSKGWIVTSAGWQITDPIWHVNCYIQLLYLLYITAQTQTFVNIKVEYICCITVYIFLTTAQLINIL